MPVLDGHFHDGRVRDGRVRHFPGAFPDGPRRGFRGGVHPPPRKELTALQPIEDAPPPAVVVLPLWQHVGAPAFAVVQAGDAILVGQRVGEARGEMSAHVHASVSGRVQAVEMRPHPTGRNVEAVVIASDGCDALHPDVRPRWPGEGDEGDGGGDVRGLLRRIVREAGIVGMGGAAFPTAKKLDVPPGARLDTYILNGCECEPYLTADQRLMVEAPGQVVFGLRALMAAVGVQRGYIAVESDKPDAVGALERVAAEVPGVQVVVVPAAYPQGSEKHLVRAVLGREVPAGGLPYDVGALVSNVATAAAVAQAVRFGLPLVERVVTVAGRVKSPKNLRARIGTPLSDLIAACGGFAGTPRMVVAGGPMMGVAQGSLDAPLTKALSGVVVLDAEDVRHLAAGGPSPSPCVRCGRCLEACPMGLLPLYLSAYGERGMPGEAAALGAADCIECGCCAYVCPSRRPLVHGIRQAKADIAAGEGGGGKGGEGK